MTNSRKIMKGKKRKKEGMNAERQKEIHKPVDLYFTFSKISLKHLISS